VKAEASAGALLDGLGGPGGGGRAVLDWTGGGGGRGVARSGAGRGIEAEARGLASAGVSKSGARQRARAVHAGGDQGVGVSVRRAASGGHTGRERWRRARGSWRRRSESSEREGSRAHDVFLDKTITYVGHL
jgi:hypothetical protein